MSIQFVEVDAKKIYNDIILTFQVALEEVLYPGDERRIFLEQEAQIIVSIYNSINESAKQNLLRYAKGNVLDCIGEGRDVKRLEEKQAIVTVRFNLASEQRNEIIIPKGTRVTPDGVYFFETTYEAVILPGELYIDISAQATIGGAICNGFSPGQIKTLVDTIPFISSVSNIDTSAGGTDREPDDDGINVWSGYRERIRLSSSVLSTAGHELGYIYHAKSADERIEDISVTSPRDCEVLITVLLKNAQIPDEDILNKVLEVCSDKKVRPLTDKVSVAAPTQVTYNIELTYYISKEVRPVEETVIRSNIDKALRAYIEWQSSKMERNINPDKLRQLILNAGASRIELVSPTYLEVSKTEVAKLGIMNVTYGGLE